MKSPLIEALLNPAIYPHPTENIQLKETHISWVILTGDFAYKIKKPVDFQFLDYTTLKKREHFCMEECRLNHRLAPNLYLETLAIYGTETAPRFQGPGDIIEYAIKMRQFDSNEQFDVALARDAIGDDDMDEIAKLLARFHQQALKVNDDKDYGTPQQIEQPMLQNFEQLQPLINDPLITNKLKAIHAWSEAQHRKLTPMFSLRRNSAHKIRECHGDFYMANITRFKDKITIFDCIEFNEPFRYTDTMADVGFLMMDLLEKHRPDLAYRFLTTYLEYTDDYHGLSVLRFYIVYRAVVRIKINALRLQQEAESSPEAVACQASINNLLTLCHKLMSPPQQQIVMMHGYSGSGKTHVSSALLHLGMVRLRSDVVRQQLNTDATPHRTTEKPGQGLYAPEQRFQVYQQLMEKAKACVRAGFAVIIDAAFLQTKERTLFIELGTELGVPWFIIDCQASHPTCAQRIQQRNAQADADEANLSQATVEVLKYQEDTHDALTAIEREHRIVYQQDTIDAVMNQLHNARAMQATLIE